MAYIPSTPEAAHIFQVGDLVYVRRHQTQTLEPRWKGPYLVLLTTPMTINVEGIDAWIHVSHVRPAMTSNSSGWRVKRQDTLSRLRSPERKKSRMLMVIGLLLTMMVTQMGLDQLIDKHQLLISLYGNPCGCQGST